MVNKIASESGKKGAAKRWPNRNKLLKEISKYVSKSDLNWIQAKWKTTHLVKLLEAWKYEK